VGRHRQLEGPCPEVWSLVIGYPGLVETTYSDEQRDKSCTYFSRVSYHTVLRKSYYSMGPNQTWTPTLVEEPSLVIPRLGIEARLGGLGRLSMNQSCLSTLEELDLVPLSRIANLKPQAHEDARSRRLH
jgi:hypothetical protein